MTTRSTLYVVTRLDQTHCDSIELKVLGVYKNWKTANTVIEAAKRIDVLEADPGAFGAPDDLLLDWWGEPIDIHYRIDKKRIV